jgi:hypothetical protein
MPIKLSDLAKDLRTCTVEYEGETAEVTYKPSAYTPQVEDNLQTAMETGRPSNAIARLLDGVVTAWEVLDEEGTEIPPVFENMKTMPSAFLTTVANTITRDMQSERDDRKNSGGGSPRKAKAGRARTGTFS